MMEDEERELGGESDQRSVFLRVEDWLIELPWFTLVGAVAFPLLVGSVWDASAVGSGGGYGMVSPKAFNGLMGVGALCFGCAVLFLVGARRKERWRVLRKFLIFLYGVPAIFFAIIISARVVRFFIS